VTVEEIDIAGDPELEARFAESVPVLQRLDSGLCLYWPFEIEELYRFFV